MAAIQTGIQKEFTIGEPSGDVLQDFGVFIDHHNACEKRITELKASFDDLLDSYENATNTLSDARLSQRLTEGKLTKAAKRITELERVLRDGEKALRILPVHHAHNCLRLDDGEVVLGECVCIERERVNAITAIQAVLMARTYSSPS